MKRNLVLTMMALLIAIVGVRTANAQDFAFAATPKLAAGVVNLGAVGANSTNGALDANTPTAVRAFSTIDVAASTPTNALGPEIFAVGTAGGKNRLLILSAVGDGTFSLPQAVFLAGRATSVAVFDIDLDGLDDVVVTERGVSVDVDGDGQPDILGGAIEVFTGQLLATGIPSGFDNSVVSLVLGGATGPIPTSPAPGTPGDTPISVTINRFNGDAFGDLAYATTDGSGAGAFAGTGSATAILSTTDTGGGTPGFDLVTGIVPIETGFPLSTTLGSSGPAPRLITSEVLATPPAPGGGATPTVDATPDVAYAALDGIHVATNNVNTATPGFSVDIIAVAGTNPVGALAADVNKDNVVDLIALNAGSGNISVNLGVTGGGYGSPIRSTPVGQNPVSLSLFNFDNDGTIDVVVVNSPATGSVTGANGTVTVLKGGGNGVFTPVAGRTITIFAPAQPTSVAAGTFRAGTQVQDLVIGTTTSLRFRTNGTSSFGSVLLKRFSAVSLAASIDKTGSGDDVILIEQGRGVVFVLLNIRGFTGGNPTVTLLDFNDIFTLQDTKPTSATPFKDAQTNLTDIAVTDVGTPTNTSGFGQIIIMLNDGSGTFSDFGLFRQFVATDGATNILSADFDNNGTSDLTYIDFRSNAAFVALNDGANFFLRVTFQETGAFLPVAARLGDFNDDDRVDLVVAHQGNGLQFNQSVVTTLFGDGTGRLQPSNAILQVPNFALSLVGGVADFETNNIPRIVDFNGDGFPDLAVATTRGGLQNVNGNVPSVTLLLNRPDSPGNFNVQQPIGLIDDTPGLPINLQLESVVGGPGTVSGRQGDPAISPGGLGQGGANYVMAVGDFNADGSPDLVVTGTTQVVFDADGDTIGDAGTSLEGIPGAPAIVNFRAAIYLFGNETAGTVRVARPLRIADYTLTGVADPFFDGGDTFVACASGNFDALPNAVPDVVHISINGNIWVDGNISSILNHAPLVNISRTALNAPLGQGRKEIITSGETATIKVGAADVDGDTLTFSLVPTPTGQQPPSFVSINPTTGDITINSADINRGPGNATFRIGVQASDAATIGAGGRLPLTGRDFFTLIVLPNRPPTVSPIANQSIEAGKTTTINLTLDAGEPNQTVTATVKCDKGNFVTITGTTLTIAPQPADVGTTTCTVTARDQFGLTATTTFAVNVTAANRAPQISSIPDQTVKAGGTPVSVQISATDPDAGDQLTLQLVSGPSFVSLIDQGNGTGTLRIAPGPNDTTGGRVTVQVRDRGGLTSQTSFNITVQPNVSIQVVNYAKPNLFISGVGFGTSPTVTVNGQNVSARIIGANNNSITLKGSKKKLNLKSGPNTVVVTAGGIASNQFVLSLLVGEGD